MKGILCICIGTLFVSYVSAQDPPVCGAEDDFLPHPTDCNLYYACSGGEALLNNCPEGLWWNTLTNGCDWPNNVNCAAQSTTGSTGTGTTATGTTGTGTTGTGTTETSTGTSTGTTGTGTTTSSTGTTGTGTTDSSTGTTGTGTTDSSTGTTGTGTTDSSTGTTGTGTTDSSTGTTGTGTSTGTTGTGTIPTETTTSGTTGTGTIPTEPTDSTSTSTSTTTPATTTSDVATEPPGGLPQSCPAVDDPNEVVRLPHESICEYYYLCSEGVPKTYSCSGGQQFSPTTRKCRPANAAGCDSCPTALDTPNQVTRLPHETDCHLYYLCSADASSLVFQCRQDWQFSRNVRECLPQEDAKCLL